MSNIPRRKSDAWREVLRIINRCAVCATPYLPDDARVFGQSNSATLVHISCHHCQSFFVAMVVLLGAGVSSVGMVTDLSFSDVERLHGADPLETDDLIAGFEAINDPAFITTIV
jgi:hypothetical protein